MNLRAGIAVSVAVGVDTRNTGQVPQPSPKPASERSRPTHTPPRSIRVPDEEWVPARARVEEQGETLTDPIRELLRFLATGDGREMRALLRKYAK